MYAGTKLYHQTDHPTARIILDTQEMKPGSRGRAGGGIYFATTPELTGHKAHKNGVILEVTVDLGWIHTLVKRDPTMTLQKLKSMGFDSVCIARAVSSGQEYVVYDPRQVLSIVECRWISGYTEGEVETALRNYEDFHGRPFGSATVEQLQSSCAKIGGWLQAGPHFAESSRLLDSCQAPSHSDSSPDSRAELERNRPRASFAGAGAKLYLAAPKRRSPSTFFLRRRYQTDLPTANIILETQQKKPGLAGDGIYLATTPELTGHKAYRTGVILEVTVALGRIHTLDAIGDPTMTLQKLKAMGFDSVCIARAVSSGQEYVVYDPRQVVMAHAFATIDDVGMALCCKCCDAE